MTVIDRRRKRGEFQRCWNCPDPEDGVCTDCFGSGRLVDWGEGYEPCFERVSEVVWGDDSK